MTERDQDFPPAQGPETLSFPGWPEEPATPVTVGPGKIDERLQALREQARVLRVCE
jgi:hypothetical protein